MSDSYDGCHNLDVSAGCGPQDLTKNNKVRLGAHVLSRARSPALSIGFFLCKPLYPPSPLSAIQPPEMPTMYGLLSNPLSFRYFISLIRSTLLEHPRPQLVDGIPFRHVQSGRCWHRRNLTSQAGPSSRKTIDLLVDL